MRLLLNKEARAAVFFALVLLSPNAVLAVERGITGSVATINGEELDSTTITNFNDLIQQMPGTMLASDSPANQLAIRGLGNIDRRPIYVVDGVTYGKEFGLSIPADDIERIEVMKGAAAASIYGSRALAGVIIINTKSGANYDRFEPTPQDAPYAFTNALRDTYVAIDSTQQCDYTPGIHQSPFGLMNEKRPAAQAAWDRTWSLSEAMARDFKINPAGEFRNGTLYAPPVFSDYIQSAESQLSPKDLDAMRRSYFGSPATSPWVDFGQDLDGLKNYNQDLVKRLDADFGTPSTETPDASSEKPWTASYRDGIPSLRTIELGLTPCTEADLSAKRNDKTLKQHYRDLHQAWADWSAELSDAYDANLSTEEIFRDDGPVMDATRRRDEAKANIRALLAECPGKPATMADSSSDAMPDAPASQAGGGAPTQPEATQGEGTADADELKIDSGIRYGGMDNWGLELRIRYRDEAGEDQPVPNTMICIGPHQDFALPGEGVSKDSLSGFNADPLRVFTDEFGNGGLDLQRDSLDKFIAPEAQRHLLKFADNYAAFKGFTGADSRWGNFTPDLDYEDRSSNRGFDLKWNKGKLNFGLDLKYDKFDSRVIELEGLGNGQTSVDDLSDDVLNRFSVGARQNFSDAFSIDTKLFISTYEPERLNFDYNYYDDVLGVTGQYNNTCAEEALPPPGDPAFSSSGGWGQEFDDQWAIKRVGLTDAEDSAWSAVKDGAAPIIIGVIDTGLDWHHQEINWQNLWRNEDEIPDNYIDDDGNGYVDDVIGWDFLNNANDPWDYDGHGTFVTGIIAADRDNDAGIAGINPNARIMVLKALNSFGHTRASHIAKAIVYGTDNGAQILNLSVAGPGLPNVVREAIAYAERKGVLVIAAAGNTGESTENIQPAGVPGVLTVAATDLDDRRPSFSNYGAEIDIAAPGVDILSLRARRTDFMWNTPDTELYTPGDAYVGEDTRYYRSAGTSFAAPIVTGVASLVWGNDPSLTAADVRRIVEQSARDIETPGVDQFSGYGIVDARAALTADPAYYLDVLINGAGAVEDRGEVYLEVSGSFDADQLKRGWLEFGPGQEPTQWQRVKGELKKSVQDGALGRIPAADLGGASTWTIRLIGEHKNGTTREYRFQVDLG